MSWTLFIQIIMFWFSFCFALFYVIELLKKE